MMRGARVRRMPNIRNANRPVWRERRRGGVSGAKERREARPARLSAAERGRRASACVGGRRRSSRCAQGAHDADPGRDIAHLGHAGSVHAGRGEARPHAIGGAGHDGAPGPGAHAPASRPRDSATGRDSGNVRRGPGHGDAKPKRVTGSKLAPKRSQNNCPTSYSVPRGRYDRSSCVTLQPSNARPSIVRDTKYEIRGTVVAFREHHGVVCRTVG